MNYRPPPVLCAILVLVICAILAHWSSAHAIGLAWDPSVGETNVTYRVYMGPQPGMGTNAPVKLDAGTNTTVRVPPMQPGEVDYFTVTAARDGLESVPSNEIVFVEPWMRIGQTPGYIGFEFLGVTPTGNVPNVKYVIEFSAEVDGPWTDQIHFTPIITKYAGGTEMYHIDIPITSLPRAFARMRVVVTP